MAAEIIIQNMIRALGQSQSGRLQRALDPHFADMDERSVDDHLAFIKKFAQSVRFFIPRDPEKPATDPSTDWSHFFPFAADQSRDWRERLGADTPAHLALLLAFLEAYREAQSSLNAFTGRHLEFYYRRVLRFGPRAAMPDRAHLVLELKKNAPPIEIGPEHAFNAGKDANKVERIYRPVRTTVVNRAAVAALRSVLVDPVQDVVRFAPIANSSDGLGAELADTEPRWRGFGHAGLPLAETGFALASPVLRLQEGVRRVTVTLGLAGLEGGRLSTAALNRAFRVFLSGEKAWLGPYVVSPEIEESQLRFQVDIDSDDGPVCDYRGEVHGYRFEARTPVMQVQLNTGENTRIGYSWFQGVHLRGAEIAVDVRGIRSLVLENDSGSLNPKKAFQPFGALPTAGSRFMIGCPEALGKDLSALSLDLTWKGAPTDFSVHYRNYSGVRIGNDSFTCKVSFRDASGWTMLDEQRSLFNASNPTLEHTLEFSTMPSPARPGAGPGPGPVKGKSRVAHSLSALGSQWAKNSLRRILLIHPFIVPAARVSAEQREGFVTLALARDFLHETYRRDQTANLMTYAKRGTRTEQPVILREPYSPELQSVTLSYRAATGTVPIGSPTEADFASPEIGFYHLAHSGQRREHAYLRSQFPFVDDKAVPLVPDYAFSGALLIGLENLGPGDSASLLFQVSEGSADPEQALVDLSWSVLCDNYWKPLGAAELTLDTTNQLRTSGLVQVVVPREATVANTVMPPGLVWLRATVPPGRSVDAVSQLISVRSNAIEVQFGDHGKDSEHLNSVLPAGTIKKLKAAISGLARTNQPFASFGGRPREQDAAFNVRVAERLRHKNRALTAWDIERIVLEDFPAIHKVKCIPHASPTSWLAPGHVTVILVPSLARRNAVDPLQPRADTDTLSRVADRIRRVGGMQARYHVRNPRYQRIRLDFKVRFKPGHEFNFYADRLRNAIDRFLSPWAYGGSSDIRFGGRVYKSVLLDFVEEVDFVDFVTDFKLYSLANAVTASIDVNEITPATPDAILVSAADHVIAEYVEAR
jgi:hypothetical protein